MANQTVTTVVNYDSASISGLLDGEDITVQSGATLTFDSDTRWGQQAAVIGRVTISAATGGNIVMDGTRVWWVPFSSSTGNVPSLGTVGTADVTRSGSNVGEYLGVWTGLGVAPSAAGGAMPASGWIKLRSVSATLAAGNVLTFANGATVTLSGAGQRGWLHIVMEEIGSANTGDWEIPRLGAWNITGDWWEVGTTNGTAGQTFQLPWADRIPGVWIETGTGTNVYEFWPTVLHETNVTTSTVGTGEINKFIDCTTGGLVRIGNNGTSNIGWTPPSGRRVRVPNILLSASTSTDWAANIAGSTTLANRARTDTANAGAINWDKVIGAAFFLNLVNPYSVSLTDSAFSDQIQINNPAAEITLTNVGIGFRNVTTSPIIVTNCRAGVTITDLSVVKNTGSNPSICGSFSNIAGLTIVRSKFAVAHTSRAVNDTTYTEFVRVRDVTMTGTLFEYTRVDLTSARNCTLNNIAVDGGRITGQASVTNGFNFSDCSAVTIDGITTPGLGAAVWPATLLRSLSATSDIEVKNVGTPASPLDGLTRITTVANFSSGDSRVVFRRVYFSNVGGFLTTTNTCDQINLFNCWADGADTQVIVAANAIARGCRFTNSVTGQTSVYGVHWFDAFTSTTAGRIVIACNEPTASTSTQATVTGGNPRYTSAGSVVMPSVGDEVTWEQPYYTLGITGFANSAPTITGTNTSNFTLQFQWDTGSGWNGTWLTLNAANLSGVGAIDPATGVRLRVRATTATANASNALTFLRIDTTTTSTAQQTQYPLPGSIVNVSGLVPQSRVKISRVDTGELLAQTSSGAGSSVQFDVAYAGAVEIEARNASLVTPYRPWVTQTSISSSAPTTVIALQERD